MKLEQENKIQKQKSRDILSSGQFTKSQQCIRMNTINKKTIASCGNRFGTECYNAQIKYSQNK